MKRSYEERVNYEISRRTSRESQKQFFSGAINRMNYDSNVMDVVKDKTFACDVLCHTGFCLNVDCEHCLLEGKFKEALKDFALGIRG